MSAFSTPFIHTVNATVNPSPLVLIERIKAINKIERTGRPGEDFQYGIDFIMVDDKTGGNLNVTWMYATDVLRDADYALIVAATSTAI